MVSDSVSSLHPATQKLPTGLLTADGGELKGVCEAIAQILQLKFSIVGWKRDMAAADGADQICQNVVSLSGNFGIPSEGVGFIDF